MTRTLTGKLMPTATALAVALGAGFGMASDEPAHRATSADAVPGSAIERRFSEAWLAADPEVYTRIARAFDNEAMKGAELTGVECRATLCRISYRADSEIPVRKLLPIRLAESFQAMVTVHIGRDQRFYVDIPEVYREGKSVAQAH